MQTGEASRGRPNVRRSGGKTPHLLGDELNRLHGARVRDKAAAHAQKVETSLAVDILLDLQGDAVVVEPKIQLVEGLEGDGKQDDHQDEAQAAGRAGRDFASIRFQATHDDEPAADLERAKVKLCGQGKRFLLRIPVMMTFFP